MRNPEWATNRKYRRKPKVILINGHEVPEPHRTPLKIDELYWTITFFGGGGGATCWWWKDSAEDEIHLKNGFVHLTKEAAEKHFNALISFTAQGTVTCKE